MSSSYGTISEAFWRVRGSEIKITRSDDSSHTVFLRTYTVKIETDPRGFCTVIASSLIVTLGLTTNTLKSVRSIIEAPTVLQQASKKHTEVAILRVAAALVFGRVSMK